MMRNSNLQFMETRQLETQDLTFIASPQSGPPVYRTVVSQGDPLASNYNKYNPLDSKEKTTIMWFLIRFPTLTIFMHPVLQIGD